MQYIPHLIDGTLREHYVLLFGSAGAFAMAAGALGAWLGTRTAARAAVRALEGAQQRTGLEAEQLRRLAADVEVIGVEVERIAEAQRYAAKLLAERREERREERRDLPTRPAERRAPGVPTPH